MLTDKFPSKTPPGTLPTDSNLVNEPVQGSWLEGDKTDPRLPWNSPVQLCGCYRSTHRADIFHAKMKLSQNWQTILRHRSTLRYPGGSLDTGCSSLSTGPGSLFTSSVMLETWLNLSQHQFFQMLKRRKAFVSGRVKQTPTGPNLPVNSKYNSGQNFFIQFFYLKALESKQKKADSVLGWRLKLERREWPFYSSYPESGPQSAPTSS